MKKAVILLFSLALIVLSAPVNDAHSVKVAESIQRDHPIYPPV